VWLPHQKKKKDPLKKQNLFGMCYKNNVNAGEEGNLPLKFIAICYLCAL